MKEMIYKQDAIDALNKKKIYRPLDSDRWVISDCLNAIVNLPSAQPERTGHWIWDAGDLYCSECGTRYSDLYPDYDDSVACPHCGAHMIEEIKDDR